MEEITRAEKSRDEARQGKMKQEIIKDTMKTKKSQKQKEETRITDKKRETEARRYNKNQEETLIVNKYLRKGKK